jgi:hypothetical protein
MGELIRIKRVDENAPNMIAVINLFDNRPPARGYVLDRNLGKIFQTSGNKTAIENAAAYLEDRMHFFNREPDIYMVGFAWGNKYGKRTCGLIPFETSNSHHNLMKTRPFLVVENEMQRVFDIKGDFLIIAGIEEAYRRGVSFDQFIKNPPKIPGLEYTL